MKNAKKILTGIGFGLMPVAAKASDAWTAPTPTAPVPRSIDTVLLNTVNWLLGIIGIVSVLVIIYGGILYLTSAGSADRVKQGKDTIKYGLMGLAIAGIAYAIVTVVITTILRA